MFVKKGGRTYAKQMAEFFASYKGDGVTYEEILDLFWGEQPTAKGVWRARCHMVKARKLLRSEGLFLCDAKANEGRYKIEHDPNYILKASENGNTRANNGLAIMKGANAFFKTDPELYRMQLRQNTMKINSFIQDSVDTFLLGLNTQQPNQIDNPKK